jgi:SAM-dependent methyltransferase
MSRRDVRLGHLLRRFLDGVPLELASAMLPVSSWASVGLLIHVHLHARAQRRYEDASVASVAKGRAIGTTALGALVNSLDATVRDLQWKPEGTTWADYTSDTNYTDQAARAKRDLVARFLEHARPATVWDLGANTGDYSRLARQSARTVISFDIDPAAVERNYLRARADGDRGLLPLLMDITNPSPAQGWGHAERMSLAERGPADVVMALALVHHLAIGGNVPLASIARCFAGLGERLIIELVPKADSQVRRLLRNRPDIFPEYTREGFERAFLERFRILEVQPVEGSERWLYMMVRRQESAS